MSKFKRIKMTSINIPKLLERGFVKDEYKDPSTGQTTEWYKITIISNFRGCYDIYVNSSDIYAIYRGMSDHELEWNELLDKMNFRTPEQAESTKKLFYDLRDEGIISFDEEE